MSNSYAKQKERGFARKLQFIEMKGGKCEKCGYYRNISALDFHHIDASQKSFPLDVRHFSNCDISKLLEEAKKCMLLCANCHRELHYPFLNHDNLDKQLLEIKGLYHEIIKEKKQIFCKCCGKPFVKVTGKLYCSKECREADMYKNYPSYDEVIKKREEMHSWEEVANFYGVSRKVIYRIRKEHGL